jgi:hypothetical protein
MCDNVLLGWMDLRRKLPDKDRATELYVLCCQCGF